jgi:hypothetical protein
LPRSNLPLNIFEPRYLQMTDDILAGERLIGMIQPAAGANTELTGKEIIPLRKTGCAGRVTEYQEVDDGRVLITLTGVCRFELTEEIETEKAYRSYKVSYNKYEDDLLPGFGEGKSMTPFNGNRGRVSGRSFIRRYLCTMLLVIMLFCFAFRWGIEFGYAHQNLTL